MRHSDPRLTANIYTDVTQLPTYEAVKNLPWVEKEIKPEPETANFGPAIRTQKSVILGQNASETVAVAKIVKSPEVPDSAASRPVFSRPVAQGQLAERGRFELPLPFRVNIISNDAHSATLPPLHFERASTYRCRANGQDWRLRFQKNLTWNNSLEETGSCRIIVWPRCRFSPYNDASTISLA